MSDPEFPSPGFSGPHPPGSEPPFLEWETEMKLLNDRFFLADLVKWTGLTTLLFAAILVPLFGFSGGPEGLRAALLFLAIPPVLLLVSTLIFILVMGNRLPLGFRIDEEGIRMRSLSKRVSNINRAAMVIGALAGKPGAVGAGAIGASQERCFIPWEDLRKVRFFPEQGVIFLKGGIFSRIRIYAEPAVYEAAARVILSRLPAAAAGNSGAA